MADKEVILVLRFSAMGDVAMVASVLKELLAQNSGIQIVMVSRPQFRAFFEQIAGVVFHAIDVKEKHKGIRGLWRLSKELQQYQPAAVADLHYNLRSRIVSSFLKLSGLKLRQLDKGRTEKKALTRSDNKVLQPLTPTVERYAAVFRQLGYPLSLSHTLQNNKQPLPAAAKRYFTAANKIIGIAPFAQHIYKMYPLEKLQEVVSYLSGNNYTVLLFGGGKKEQGLMQLWQEEFANVHNTIGQFSLHEELAIISNLDLMISMDSSGMHMASLMGVRCISVWGATHPYAGFLGYGQQLEDCVQVAHPARPSSVYGNKPCNCDGVEAIELVTPEMIIAAIKA